MYGAEYDSNSFLLLLMVLFHRTVFALLASTRLYHLSAGGVMSLYGTQNYGGHQVIIGPWCWFILSPFLAC